MTIAIFLAVPITVAAVVTNVCTSRSARTPGDIGHYAGKVGKISAVLKIKICNRESVNRHIIGREGGIVRLNSRGYSYAGIGNYKLGIAEVKIAISVSSAATAAVTAAVAVAVPVAVTDNELLSKAAVIGHNRYCYRTGRTGVIVKNLAEKHKIFPSTIGVIFHIIHFLYYLIS